MKRRKRSLKLNRKGRRLVIGFVLVFTVISMASGISILFDCHRMDAQAATIQKQIDEEVQKSEDLKEQLTYVGTDAYIEEVAHQKLGMVYPNEVFITPEE